jgi:hypothetical protein
VGANPASPVGDPSDGYIPPPRAAWVSLLGAPEKDIVGSAHGIPASPLQLVLKKVQRPIIELKKVNNM